MRIYENIVNRLKAGLAEDGVADADGLFTVPSEEELSVLTDLYGTYSHWSCAYAEEELTALRGVAVPEPVLRFYQDFSPKSDVSLYGDVNLLSLKSLKRENTASAPGALLIRYGVLTFATTAGGNAVCIDLNRITRGEPRVLLADHSIFYDRTITVDRTNRRNKTGKRAKYRLSYEVIDQYCPQVSETFSEFLERLANRAFDEIEDDLK